jgi:hypothetical protein
VKNALVGRDSVEPFVAACESLRLDRVSPYQKRPASLFPFLHLLGKRALGAIGVVLQTKIFVNLKQSLLLRDGFREARPARVPAEKPRRPCFQSSIRQTRGQFFVGGPNVAAVREEERQKHVREDLRDSPTMAISFGAISEVSV